MAAALGRPGYDFAAALDWVAALGCQGMMLPWRWKLAAVSRRQGRISPWRWHWLLPLAAQLAALDLRSACIPATRFLRSSTRGLPSSCTGPAIKLCRDCILAAHGLHSSCTGPAFQLHCACILAARGLHSSCTGPAVLIHWACILAALGMHSSCTGCAF